jgi:hypothetical protein
MLHLVRQPEGECEVSLKSYITEFIT